MPGPWDAFQPQQAAPPPPGLSSGVDVNGYPLVAAPGPASSSPPAAQAGPWAQFAAPASSALADYPAAPPDPGHSAQPAATPSFGMRVDQAGRSIAQGATLGFGDEMAAGLDAATHGLLGRGSDADTLGQRYDANLAAERAKDAAIPNAIAIPGQLAGGIATIVAGAPGAVAKGAGSVIRLLPGGANALSTLGAGADIAGNALAQIPRVGGFVAPVARIAGEGAVYGGIQGFGEGEGGFDQRIQSAEMGAATGAALAPAVAGAGALVAKGVGAVGSAMSEAGFGRKNVLADLGGTPIAGTTGQPVVATSGVARAAGQQLADAATDLPKVQAALANSTELVPGSRPTTFQATGDSGLGQKELEVRNTPGSSQAFIGRANEQNAARVGAISQSVPETASSADLVNNLDAQRAALAAQQDAAASQARQGTLQNVGGATDGTPTQAGADLRAGIDQVRAPVVQEADAAVQQGQARVQGALDAVGGTPAGDAGTAQQQYGQQFRGVFSAGDATAKANVSRLADAIDPDGTLAVDMSPIRAKAREIAQGMSPNAAPPVGAEAGIMHTASTLPDVQSFQDLAALRSRLTTAISQERGSPTGDPLAVRRMSMLLDGVHDAMADAASHPDVPVPTPATASPVAAPNVGGDVFTPSGQRVGVRYELADAGDLVTSHGADMQPNPAFPPELQPRARDRAASQFQVGKIANQLQPERLGASSTVADGAPIVGPDGIVESGNGRVMALRQAYQANGPQAKGYRDWLASQGHDTAGMDQPVLIRRRTTDMTPEQRVAFAGEGSTPTTLAMSATERAAGDARRLPDDVLHQVQPGDVTDPANRDFVRGFLRNAVEPGQEGSFVTADGSLSQEGAARVRAALVHKAYGDQGLSAGLAESTDPTARVLAGAMQDAAGPMARLRAGIAGGHVDPGVDIAPSLVEAAQTVQQARQRGLSLADAVSQRDAFNQVSPQAERLLRAAYGDNLAGRMSRDQFSNMLSTYARRGAEQSTGGNLFGANLTADQLLDGAVAQYGKVAEAGRGQPLDAGVARAVDGPRGDPVGRSVPGAGRQEAPGGGGGEGSQAQIGRRVLDQAPSALTPNFDQAAADRYQAMRSAHAERKETYGAKVPGVGPVLASGPQSGTFRMPDSSVPSAIFSKGAGAAERVQAAIKAGLSPAQIADYAAFDLRRVAQKPDGTLDPAAFQKWRQQNGEAFQALTQADPSIRGRFDTAQQATSRLAELQTQRAMLDTTHPLKPGWGDAEVMQRVWQPGPKGADSVRTALAASKGTPLADHAISDYAAYSLRRAAAPDGVLDPAKYANWAKAYDGALSARPDIKAQFDTAAKAQSALDASVDQHAQALKVFQSSVAKHFLGGADPADRVGQILNSATRQRDMADLANLTRSDPDARAGIQRAVVDHIFDRLQGNNIAGDTGLEKLKSDQFQTFIGRAAPAMREVMTPEQVDMLQKVAADLQRANLSVEGTRVAGGSDTAQKAALLASGGMGSTLMGALKSHGLTGLLTLIGLKGGAVGAFIGNKAGAAIGGLKAAGIKQTGDLVKEAMLNPELARLLLVKLTPQNQGTVTSAMVGQLGRIAAARGAHTAVAIQRLGQPQGPASPQNALSSLGSMGGIPAPPRNALAIAGVGR